MADTVVNVSKEDQELKEELEMSWSELLPELLGLILSHLFAGDFTTFRSVCKSWRSINAIIRPPPPPTDLTHPQSPYLLVLKNEKCKFFHPMYNGAYEMIFPELSGARIRFSKYGWLLLTRHNEDDVTVFFFNPFTRVKIELPNYPFSYAFNEMCFSSPPTSSNCFVIGIEFRWQCGIIKRGEESWTFHRFSKGCTITNCQPLLYKGLCYFLEEDGNVAELNPNHPGRGWTIIRRPLFKNQVDSLQNSFIVENNGELLAVFVTKEVQNVEVWGMNLSKKVWRPIQKLSNKMLYLSPWTSFLEPAVVRGMSNKIYFPNVVQDKNCVFYSLATKRFHTFVGDYSKRIPCNVKQYRNCTWIKPMSTTVSNEELQW